MILVSTNGNFTSGVVSCATPSGIDACMVTSAEGATKEVASKATLGGFASVVPVVQAIRHIVAAMESSFGKSYAAALGGLSSSMPITSSPSMVSIIGDTLSVQLNEKAFKKYMILYPHSIIAWAILYEVETLWTLYDL